MRIRLGYVANSLGLWNSSPSKSLTFARFKALPTQERMGKLKEVTAQNLYNTKRILYYNVAHEISLYRFSSSLVPLATHPEVLWDFISPFKKEWEELGRIVRRFNLRTSFHPNQFTLFTSPRREVTDNAVKDMEYHYTMLEAMDIVDRAVINIHIGGAYGNKKEAINSFHENIKSLPEHIKKVTTLENDDKTYDIEETLLACEKEGLRMVLDYHHYMANTGEHKLLAYLQRIFDTWKNSNVVPKVHLSSPKSEEAFRFHANFVSSSFVLPFLKMTKEINQDFDIMVEAKEKDLAMLRLVEELASLRGVKRIKTSVIEW